MHIHNFHDQTMNGGLIILLELIIVLMCMMVIKKYVLVFGKGAIQGLDDTMITAEAKDIVNFTRPGTRFSLNPYYNLKKINSKQYFETFYNRKHEENRAKRICACFSADYKIIDVNDILDIHKYLMKIK